MAVEVPQNKEISREGKRGGFKDRTEEWLHPLRDNVTHMLHDC